MVLRDFAKKTKFHDAGGPGYVVSPRVEWENAIITKPQVRIVRFKGRYICR